MGTCKHCKHWTKPDDARTWRVSSLCEPLDTDGQPMQMPYKVRICKMPTQTFCEFPTERNGFGLADGSTYFALLATAEDFGCVRFEASDAMLKEREK